MAQSHAHGYVRARYGGGRTWAVLALLVAKLHLPMRLVVDSGTLPHHPDCTAEEAVLEQE